MHEVNASLKDTSHSLMLGKFPAIVDADHRTPPVTEALSGINRDLAVKHHNAGNGIIYRPSACSKNVRVYPLMAATPLFIASRLGL